MSNKRHPWHENQSGIKSETNIDVIVHAPLYLHTVI